MQRGPCLARDRIMDFLGRSGSARGTSRHMARRRLAKSVDKDSYDVFLSYSRADQATVEGVAKRLHGLGLQVFLDRWYLAPGCSWPQACAAAGQRRRPASGRDRPHARAPAR
ncbi:MAG: toll/interleukin-1 receptor domain-containing protein, partial [Geminicoccaceae bacterium]